MIQFLLIIPHSPQEFGLLFAFDLSKDRIGLFIGVNKKRGHDKTISRLIYVLLRLIPNKEIKEWEDLIIQIHRMSLRGK